MVKDGSETHAIQVCWSMNEAARKREVNGLIEALEELKLEEGVIITEDQEDKMKADGKNIIFTPLWKWLVL